MNVRTVKGILKVIRATTTVPYDVKRRRELMARLTKVTTRIPPNITQEAAVIDGVSVEWYRPKKPSETGLILYLHGGAFVYTAASSQQQTIFSLIENSGLNLISVNYRLAPEYPYPAGLMDALVVYKALIKQGYNPKEIAVAGDSAGGGLSLSLVASLKLKSEPLPGALVLMSPWTDLTFTGKSHQTNASVEAVLTTEDLKRHADSYIGHDSGENPLISPLYADFTEFPPMLIHVGDEEILLDDALMVAEKAQAQGVEVRIKVFDGMFHVFSAATFLPEGKTSMEEIGRYILEKVVLHTT